jgi:SAM-dependent methyltransferase
VEQTGRLTLRQTFDDAAVRYDRARPGYPEALFDDLAALAGLAPGSRVLEVGCGTGQATLPLARRGYAVCGVELGARLAEVARANLAAFPAVSVVTADFEQWPLPADAFDAVVAATSFHWLDPHVRLAKTADALRPGGALAVIATDHVAGGSDRFFAEVQGCYERWMPGTPPGLRLPAAADIPARPAELGRGGRFERAVCRRYETDLEYSTAAYLDVLQTYSNHLALEAGALRGLLGCIADLIDSRFGGRVVKRYLTELAVAFRPGARAGGNPS